MKKNKFLVPLAAVTAVTGTVTPLVALTSCSCSTKTTLCISNSGILTGFREDATDEQIEKEFGDTLVIPKDVKAVCPYAFYDGKNSTIPSSITKFRFENDDPTGSGYECTSIGDYAFAGAPFEDITITCERVQPDGEQHPDPGYWKLQDNYWGLLNIGEGAFYQNTNLTSLKLPGSIRSNNTGGIGNDAFSCQKMGLYYTNLKTIDFSDWLLNDTSGQEQFPDNLPNIFHLNLIDEGEKWTGTFVARYYDGIYGPSNTNELQGINAWRAAWGLEAIGSIDLRHTFGTESKMAYWGEPK